MQNGQFEQELAHWSVISDQGVAPEVVSQPVHTGLKASKRAAHLRRVTPPAPRRRSPCELVGTCLVLLVRPASVIKATSSAWS